jgi:hypothetical protein
MKKLLLLTLLTGFWAQAQTWTFADPTFKQLLLNQQIPQIPDAGFWLKDFSGNTILSLDLNGNGEIELSEIQNVKTAIFNSGSGIPVSFSSLVDFNLFTNLEELTIDYLICSGELVTSGMPHLRTLQLKGHCNFSLDCSNSQLLEEYTGQQTDSGNSYVVILHSVPNQITAFENCTHLKKLILNDYPYDFMSGTNNDINSSLSNYTVPTLDLSTLIALEELIDSSLPVHYTNLSSCHNLKRLHLPGKLNVDGGPYYSHDYVLTELPNMPQLEWLNLLDNHFTSLNISQNHQLKGLVVSGNKIPLLDLSGTPLLEQLR